MIKTLRPGMWTCSRCLRQPALLSPARSLPLRPSLQLRSWHSSSPRSLQYNPAHTSPVDHAASTKHDDAVLRDIFDSPRSFKSIAKSLGQAISSENVGLFRNKYLTSASGFNTFAQVTINRAQRLVDRVLAASTTEEYKSIVKDLDRLSDLLCRVLDVSDFVRVTHPDTRIQAAAHQAWSMVYQYMNMLNTTTGLSDQLAVALGNPEVFSSWNEEEQTVAQLLQQDFLKSAVHMPQESRDEFVKVSQKISDLGCSFTEDTGPAQPYIERRSDCFHGLDPRLGHKFIRGGTMRLPTMSPEASVALKSVYAEDTRKAIYYATRTASPRSIKVLETMLRLRAQLAQLSGFESYGHMALQDRMMAKSPESVNQFLTSLSRHNASLVSHDVADLLAQKRSELKDPRISELHPWDKDYYMASIRDSMRSRAKQSDFLSSFLSLGTVMQGLSRLFNRLYGIRFVPRETLPGETWHSDVRRLDVISDTEGHVAVLYCDLFYREDKSPNPAHFTVRCSREISQLEVQEVAEESASIPDMPQFESPLDAANDGMHISTHGGPIKQLPTIALVCDFPQMESHQPALLDFYQMETLFHEMGHAVHSILARTSMQNVSGTRCATDFAELPSTLMEHFAADDTVLSLFARHHATDEPLQPGMVAEKQRATKRFEASERETQIILAMMDQAYHSPEIAQAGADLDTSAIHRNLQRQFGKLPPDAQGTSWQGFFGHLFGYGSTYYSYLFDQTLSEQVWRVVFSSGQNGGAVSRENGERLKENLLKWGGSRDPWRCLSDTLQDKRLLAGDEEAMRIVGTWGVTKDNSPLSR